MRASRLCLLALIALSGAVALGWCFHLTWFIHPRRSWPVMSPVTALTLTALGAAAWLRSERSATAQRAARAMAALLLGVSGLWLLLGVTGNAERWSGIAGHLAGGQMATIGVLSTALLAAALLASHRAQAAVTQALALAAGIAGSIGVMRFLYDSPLSAYAPMSLHASVGVLLAAAAILLTRHDASLLVLLRDPGAGGTLARRLLPLAIGSPLLSGVAVLNIAADLHTHVHVLAPLNALVFGGLVWGASSALRRSDAIRQAELAARLSAETDLAQEHERFLLLTRATLDTVMDWEARTDRLWLSANLVRAFGWEVPKNVNRQWIRDRVHPDDLPRMAAELEAANQARAELWTTEHRFRHADGGYRNVMARGVLLRDGGGHLIRMIGTMLDISDRIATEQALRDRTEALERSNGELERFAQIASHDLQEPLRTISSFVQLLAKRHGDKLDEQGKRYMHYVVDGAERMRALINALLTYSRVDRADAPVTGEVQLAKVMMRARADLRTAIAESGAELEHGELPAVQGNEIQLTQLLINIIGNAVKYRAPGTAPRIRVSAAREGELWRISVADDGIGIDPQYFERIFVVFQRLHTREVYDGTGVGLAICKRIVERHGGRIWVESQPGAGSTFHFTLRPAEGGAHVDPLA